MKKLGTVSHISSQHNIVVRSDFAPNMGKNAIIRKGNNEKVGYVYDIIGPKKNPYILIKPFNKLQDHSKLVGETLYIKIVNPNFKKNK